jgi:uncharacterized protein involved in response to NO
MTLLKLDEPAPPAISLTRPGGRPHNPPAGIGLLRLGFRPFYLAAALLAALAVPLWVAVFLGHAPGGLAPGLAWHAHEMVFGFAVAVLVGFLYTAARNWTGMPTPRGTHLALLVLLWAAGRLAMLFASPPLAAVADLAFLPLAAWPVWRLLRRADNRRNLFLPALLGAMAGLNLLFHATVIGLLDLNPLDPPRIALLLVVLIEVVMGARVIPSFTANAAPQARPLVRPRHDRLSIALVALAAAAWSLGLPEPSVAGLSLAAALTVAARGIGYQPWKVLAHPLLWILHLSYLWIAIGFALLAASALGWSGESAAFHALGVGATGGLIVGMITRTVLGHTGRPLRAGPAEVAMYALLQAGALLRVSASLPWGASAYELLLVASSACWSVSFAIYLTVYGPRLARPRVDGRDG